MSAPAIQKITPFLWFDGNAEEAVRFYTGLFPGSRVVSTSCYGEAGPGPKGSVMTIEFELSGQRFVALNGGPQYRFTEAVSLVVRCETQAEIDAYWDRLTSGGGVPVQCGWLKDRFGLSWQIVPAGIFEMLKDPARSDRVMRALMGMVKLDMAKLRAAAEGR